MRQDVDVDRPNAVGILRGDGTGLSLSFNGHMDTSFTGTSADLRMVAHIEPEAGEAGESLTPGLNGDETAAIAAQLRREDDRCENDAERKASYRRIPKYVKPVSTGRAVIHV